MGDYLGHYGTLEKRAFKPSTAPKAEALSGSLCLLSCPCVCERSLVHRPIPSFSMLQAETLKNWENLGTRLPEQVLEWIFLILEYWLLKTSLIYLICWTVCMICCLTTFTLLILNSPTLVNIICIGPMTNFPELLKCYPNVASKAHIYAMAGSISQGYHNSPTPVPEYNIHMCPWCMQKCLAFNTVAKA